ncbi:MAG: ArsR/SmtB family transcription factor [Streptosporangiales bacterium]
MTHAAPVEVFAALADNTRQRILEQLATQGRASATALSPTLDVTRQAVQKHLHVLQEAGLVESTRDGRAVVYVVRSDELTRSANWLQDLAAGWDRRLAHVKAVAEAPPR